jgi:transcriptional regulator with XRE-family HTH domain
MIIERNEMKQFRPAKRRIEVTVGESVRIIRELQEMSQSELATESGIPQSTISAIENSRINIGVERAKQLARALKCHPAVLVFPGWEIDENAA